MFATCTAKRNATMVMGAEHRARPCFFAAHSMHMYACYVYNATRYGHCGSRVVAFSHGHVQPKALKARTRRGTHEHEPDVDESDLVSCSDDDDMFDEMDEGLC